MVFDLSHRSVAKRALPRTTLEPTHAMVAALAAAYDQQVALPACPMVTAGLLNSQGRRAGEMDGVVCKPPVQLTP